MKIINSVPLPIETYRKINTISKIDQVPIHHIVSQAVQEWTMRNFGKRYPRD
tara:strand:- start:58 stop:213 length:156 start_codon:yes stop_codon:yes gene_type:complete